MGIPEVELVAQRGCLAENLLGKSSAVVFGELKFKYSTKRMSSLIETFFTIFNLFSDIIVINTLAIT